MSYMSSSSQWWPVNEEKIFFLFRASNSSRAWGPNRLTMHIDLSWINIRLWVDSIVVSDFGGGHQEWLGNLTMTILILFLLRLDSNPDRYTKSSYTII